jgi:hypothetical protein
VQPGPEAADRLVYLGLGVARLGLSIAVRCLALALAPAVARARLEGSITLGEFSNW